MTSGRGDTGASTFLLEEGLDTGPVFGAVTEPVRRADTSGELLGRLAVSGARLLVATLDGIEDGTVTAVPQPLEGVSQAPKLTVDDARIAWGAPALAIDRLVRGCTPAPGAWTTLRGERLRLGPMNLRPDVTDLAPGRVRAEKVAVLVGTGSHAVELGEVRPQGKRAMTAADWARGVRIAAAESFA